MALTPPLAAQDSWLDDLLRWAEASGASASGVAAAAAELVGRVAGADGIELASSAHLEGVPLDRLPPPDPAWAEPALVGRAYEAMLSLEHRRRAGVFYTPPSVAEGVFAMALDGHAVDPAAIRCLDPAVGGGAFLLAAADALAGAGVDPATIVSDRLWGIDADPAAVEVAATSLQLWAAVRGVDARAGDHLVAGDSLADGGRAATSDGPFDLVVGNPPFGGQLSRRTARDRELARSLADRFGGATAGYADNAVVFWLAALDLARRGGGRVAMVLPQSVLVAGHARAARDAVLERAVPTAVWVAASEVFAAGVRVCAVVVELDGDASPPTAVPDDAVGDDAAPGAGAPSVTVGRRVGAGFEARGPALVDRAELRRSTTWGGLTSGLLGVPAASAVAGRTVGDLADATAGFRDQYYGLVPHVREHVGTHALVGADGDAGSREVRDRLGVPDGRAALVAVGLIDPARIWWGSRPVRFARRRWEAPVVALGELAEADPALHRWVTARLVPKVLVATQTRVVEAAVDEAGVMVPSVPTIAVHTEPDLLWPVAAALSSPVVSARAVSELNGSALSVDAIRLSARAVLELPLPVDAGAWEDGAARMRAAASATTAVDWREHLTSMGEAMVAAHGHPDGDDLLDWWVGRLPRWPEKR
ncbi:MAG: N-6 DNA methylase [Actinomycetota bacterium]|nr:N-6 DNA methylase [Actinomycetota bacterium]